MVERMAIPLAVALLAAGCAGYKVQRDGTGTGYDVYAPAPYLLRESTAKGTYTFRVVYLPDHSRRYRVHSWAGLGKSAVEFQFQDGWMLTRVQGNVDNTSVAESLGTLADLVQRFAGAPGGVTPRTLTPPEQEPPVLYQVVFDERTGQACGLRQVCVTNCPEAAATYTPPVLPAPCAPPPAPADPCAP